MSYYTLGTGLTAANRVDPNGLTYKPYLKGVGSNRQVGTDWTTQGKKGILPKGISSGLGDMLILLRAETSVAGATVVINFVEFNPVTQKFAPRQDDSSVTIVGDSTIPIYNPSNEMIYPYIASVSSGTVSLYVEGRNAEVA